MRCHEHVRPPALRLRRRSAPRHRCGAGPRRTHERERAGGGGGQDRGSTIPLILGFFIIALIMVGGSVALGQAFVQQRDLQDVCDGAAAAAAAGAADLDRSRPVAAGGSLGFAGVDEDVQRYLARDPSRSGVQIRAEVSADRQRVTLTCSQTRELALGALFGRSHVHHTATSSARAAVVT